MLASIVELWHAFWALPHIRVWIGVAWLLYLLPLLGWIVLQKREPVATLSWVLSLALMPYLGFFVYFLFGPQKIKRQNLRRRSARDGLGVHDAHCQLDADCTELALLAQSTTGLPPSTASSALLLVDGAATYDAILDAVAAARDHVHLEYYIFQPDRTGTRLRDALVERARAGVKVRLLLDAVGSARVRASFLQPLVDAGAEHAWFHPSSLRLFARPWLNLRSHRKLVIVDGRVAFTGGINVTDEQDERLRDDAYRDLHLRLEGPVLRSMQQVFIEDWAYASGQGPRQLQGTRLWPHDAVQAGGGIAVQTLTSGPDSSWEAIHRLHVGAIHEARQRAWLVTPYFVPGEAARMALTSAALGGLDVRLLVPRMSDSRLVTWAARSYYDELLAAGVKVYEYGPRMLHTKALVCDDNLAIVGSANFDHRSFRLNFEMSMLFRDRVLTATLAQFLETEFAASQPVDTERPRRLWRDNLPEALARLASPLL